MNNYEERQATRVERFHDLAEKARQQSTDAYEASNRATEGITFGQPILVGHHSEGRHRKALKRSWDAMGKSVKLTEKAEYYENKANAAENNNVISSDDPDAIKKLKVKLEKLEADREKIKDWNKDQKKQGKPIADAYHLQNLGANIRTVKERIKFLEARKDDKTLTVKIGEVEIIDNVEDNRIQIFFPEIPSVEVRTKLKQNGFRWARYNGCWQAYRKKWNMNTAKESAKLYNGSN